MAPTYCDEGDQEDHATHCKKEACRTIKRGGTGERRRPCQNLLEGEMLDAIFGIAATRLRIHVGKRSGLQAAHISDKPSKREGTDHLGCSCGLLSVLEPSLSQLGLHLGHL